MFSYTLAMEIDNQVFLDACNRIEKAFPSAKKEELLIDVDGSLLQDYYINEKRIRIQNDCDVYAVYVDSEIDLNAIFVSLV